MTQYHEPFEELSDHDRNLHRALTSFKEEIEAIDWYHQRVVCCKDEQLRAILAHNRDEEIEHACMVLEWLRRNMPGWSEQLRTYLFTEAPVLEVEEAMESRSESSTPSRDLAIGSLKGAE
ncbi:MAG TPA: ferritin-like domain-containing protein [Vicinamibacteria bacterium]|nr:ferritin-like domain-containing protein [Vicinamibacteria bacterium]